MTLTTGVRSLTRPEYDALPFPEWLNYSRLRLMGRSPAHFRHGPTGDTAERRRGRVTHSLLLEPSRFSEEHAIWTGKVKRGKAWDAFEAENEGRELLSAKEFDLAKAIVAALRASPQAAPYLAEGAAEMTLLWELLGRKCKGRVDWISPLAMVDLKTTRNGSPDGFAREAWNFAAHVQGAWYSDGYEKATGNALPYVLLAVEPEPPHVVQVYRMPEAVLDAGRREYARWLESLAICEAANEWPGYSMQELDLSVPRWAESHIYEEATDG